MFSLVQNKQSIQARSQTFLWGGSNRSNFGTFYDYGWIILRSHWIWSFWGGVRWPPWPPPGYGPGIVVFSSVQNKPNIAVFSSVQNRANIAVLSSVQNKPSIAVFSSVQNIANIAVFSSEQNEANIAVLIKVYSPARMLWHLYWKKLHEIFRVATNKWTKRHRSNH